MTTKYKIFHVQGWVRRHDEEGYELERFPLPSQLVQSRDGFNAANAYADMFALPPHEWNNGRPDPRVVIRVTDCCQLCGSIARGHIHTRPREE